jgi:hypothetical protein
MQRISTHKVIIISIIIIIIIVFVTNTTTTATVPTQLHNHAVHACVAAVKLLQHHQQT